MELSKVDRDDVLMAVRIEFERAFGVLTNGYGKAEQSAKAAFLTEIELKLKESLAEISRRT